MENIEIKENLKIVTSLEVGESIFEVLNEVLRQEKLWDRWAEKWNDSDDIKLRILVEEVGEIAMALNDKDDDNLPIELAQVAAVCVSWLSSIHHRRHQESIVHMDHK